MEGSNFQDDYDYFTPALKDCWHFILGYILKPEDLHSLFYTCPIFSNMLHPRMMSDLIVPTMLKSVSLPKSSLLSLRAVNKGMKRTLDSFLNATEPDWLSESCTFSFSPEQPQRLERLEKFRNQFAAHVLQSPILSKHWHLRVRSRGPSVEQSVAFLQTFGHQISTLSITILTGQDLSRLLIHLPNVASLTLGIPGHIQFPPLDAEERHQPIHLPRLPLLTSLNFWSITIRNHKRRAIKTIFEHIIRRYGAQLEKLVFNSLTWNFIDLDDQSILNLRYLKIYFGFEHPDKKKKAFEKLSKLKAPNLHCLDLGGFVEAVIIISMPIISAVENFRESLQELSLPRQLREFFGKLPLCQVDPFTLKAAPEVKKLVVATEDLNSQIWFVFPYLLPNLEEKFDSGSGDGGDNPSQDVGMLRKMFGRFNRLKDWCLFVMWDRLALVKRLLLLLLKFSSY
ncbi:hypothetical protein Ocin01_19950 [Orchesella cincta]|uniref:F-box domain-containing protein n=1 Tax=Orchesella cincta TaxID=48709 RepID=A0A1D2M1A7_ORCCI|nr:hypothetical protein Ocin01_19950 [Orchesella cincta]